MSSENSNTTQQKSSSKAPIVIVIALAIVIAVFFMLKGGSSYEAFSMAMNKTFGEGKWSAEKHSVGFLSGSLTVEGFSSTLPIEGTTLKADSIEVKSSLSEADIQSLSEKKDWDSKTPLKLADKLIAKGVSIDNEKIKIKYSYDEIGAADLTLEAANENTPKGAAGYIKSLSGESFNYKNMKSSFIIDDNSKFEVNTGYVNARDFSFDGKGVNNLFAEADPTGIFDVVLGLKVKEYTAKDGVMTANFDDGGKKININMSLDEAVMKDMDSIRKISAFDMRGLKIKFNNGDVDFAYTMGEVSGSNIDADAYVDKLLAIAKVSLSGEEQDIQRVWGSMQTLGDMFVTPVGFDKIAVKKTEFTFAESLVVKFEEISAVGPYKAGEIPVSSKSFVKGFEVKLPEQVNEKWAESASLVEFVKNFGMSTFILNGDVTASYDPKTGVLKSSSGDIKITDLFDLSATMTIGGLTKERLEVLKATSLDNIFAILLAPEDIFGDMSLNDLQYKITDHGLLEKIYHYNSKTSQAGKTVEAVRAEAVTEFKKNTAMSLDGSVENQDALINPVASFLEKGGTITLKITPQPPLSVSSVMQRQGDSVAIMNSLNICVASDGNEGTPLKFIDQTAAKNEGDSGNEEKNEIMDSESNE